MSTIDVTKLVRDVQESTMQQAFYLQSKAFFEKNNEHINEIARLKAEVERLAKELSDEKSANANVEARQNSANRGLSMDNFNLKAEVERLRKAGDKLVEVIQEMDVIIDMDSDHPEVEAWNAAKEGKQP